MFDATELKALCRLARLRPPEEEFERLRSDLDRILQYVRVLEELDLSDPRIDPDADTGRLREDVQKDAFDRDPLLENAPHLLDGHFAVPAVISREKAKKEDPQ